jgi:hypothetical protein
VRFTTKMSKSEGEKKYPRLEKLNTYPTDSCLDTEKAQSWAKVCHPNRFPPHTDSGKATILQSANNFLEREGGREEEKGRSEGEKGQIALKGSNKTMGI